MADPRPGDIEVIDNEKVRATLARIPCANCGKHALRLEIRYGPMKVSPVGTFSLAGAQMKFSATMEAQGVLVCNECEWERVESVA